MPSVFTQAATFHFYGNEHPAMGGKPFDINPGAEPQEVSPELAEYLATIPGVEFTTPLPKSLKK